MKQNQLAGLSILLVSFFGSLFNWLVVIIIVKDKTLKSPFMFLTFVKSFCDAVCQTIYFVYVTPMVMFIESTRKYVFIASILSFAVITTVNFILGCHIQYDPNSWVSFYDTSIPICDWYVMYGDFIKNLFLVFVDFGIDLVTLFKVQKTRRQFRKGKRAENYTKKETDFLKQTCGQGFCYLIGYASYLMVPEMETNKYVAFFMSVMSWCAIAMIDGLFTIVYNCEIRTKLIKENTDNSVISVTSSKR